MKRNQRYRQLKGKQKKLVNMKGSIQLIARSFSTYVFLFPLHHPSPGHYNLLHIICCQNAILFYDEVKCYDSMRSPGRHTFDEQFEFAGMLKIFNQFITTFLLPTIVNSIDEKLYEDELFRKFQFISCPQQHNCYDCGLFTVVNIYHIIDGIQINVNTYSQENISQLRHFVGSYLSTKRSLHRCTIPKIQIRQLFQFLKPCENDINGPDSSSGNETSPNNESLNQTSSTSTTLIETQSNNVSSLTDELSQMENERNAVGVMLEYIDMAFEDLLEENKINKEDDFGFQYLDDWNVFINTYERESGISLAAVRSKRSSYREYCCISYVKCTFMIRLGKLRNHDRYS